MKDENIKFPLSLINEDGTSKDDFPENPLLDKWIKLYQKREDGALCCDEYREEGKLPIMNYNCVLCSSSKCFKTNNFIIPEEDKEVYKAYNKSVDEYNKLHNPRLYKIANQI